MERCHFGFVFISFFPTLQEWIFIVIYAILYHIFLNQIEFR
jgi:hypothetical protein